MTSGRTDNGASAILDRLADGASPASHRRAAAGLREPFAALAFWTAVGLPAVYVPLLLAGIESPEGLGLFLGLFGLHALALLGGRGHKAATA